MTATRAQRAARGKRRPIELSLSTKALAALAKMAPNGRRSELVEALILRAWESVSDVTEAVTGERP